MTKPKDKPRDRTPTKSQQAILQLVSVGMSDEEIAFHMGIKKTTVRTHIAAALTRLGLHTRAHAIAVSMRNGWIT